MPRFYSKSITYEPIRVGIVFEGWRVQTRTSTGLALPIQTNLESFDSIRQNLLDADGSEEFYSLFP